MRIVVLLMLAVLLAMAPGCGAGRALFGPPKAGSVEPGADGEQTRREYAEGKVRSAANALGWVAGILALTTLGLVLARVALSGAFPMLAATIPPKLALATMLASGSGYARSGFCWCMEAGCSSC